MQWTIYNMKKYLFVIQALLLSVTLAAQNTVHNKDSLGINGPGTYIIINNNLSSIRIPFRMHNGKPLMDVEINGKKATLMIDNGVLWEEIWLFGSSLVDELQLSPIDAGELGGSGEGDPTQIFSATNLTLKFKDIVFYEQPVLVSPSSAGFAKMFPGSDGQLCNTFFKHFIVEFDFITNDVVLHKPEEYRFEGNGSTLRMSENKDGTYAVPFSFTMLDGKTYTDDINIDFGGIYALKIALNNKYNIKPPESAEKTESYGAQGKTPGYKGKIKNFTIGKYKFDNPTVAFGDKNTSRIHPNNLGVIGLPLFMKFNITFDYFSNQLYIIPNENFENTFQD